MNLQESFETGLVLTGLIVVTAVVVFIWSISPKILGFLMILFGLFTLRYFPRMSKYQFVHFQRTGLLIGILFLAVGGIILVLF
jgi:hypothetical protein